MTMVAKITVSEKFANVIDFLNENGQSEMAEFITERKELHEKRNASRGKSKKAIATDNALVEQITEVLNGSTGMTCSEIVASKTEWAGYDKPMSTSKMSSLLKGMANVERTVVKGKAYFSLV